MTSDVLVIGYGSLMSGLGLLPLGRMRLRGACRVALRNAHRGFGKFSQHGDRFAMVLEPAEPGHPISAQVLSADAPHSGGPEGIGLLVQSSDLARLCDREGYSSGALQQLREAAGDHGCGLAAYLWSLLEEAQLDVARFHHHLYRLVHYTSAHYVPHPIRLDGGAVALTFLAPGREGSGSERVVPVRVRTGNHILLTASEAWQRKPNRTPLHYILSCVLGGMHGVGIDDLLQPLVGDVALGERLRAACIAEQPQELARFLHMTGLGGPAFGDAFGSPAMALQRSGLGQFLKG